MINRLKWISLLILLLLVFLYPLTHSEAQPDGWLSKEGVCEKLALMRFEEMPKAQHNTAKQCDKTAAEQAWEQDYGQFSEQDWLNAVVYE